MSSPSVVPASPWRQRIVRGALWFAAIAWGVLLGAKVFDLVVLAGAWSAAPPASLRLLPYGAAYPVNTGDFFIPPSALLLVATWIAVFAGWRTPMRYRRWLLASALTILVVLVFTVASFWPMNAALWAVAKGAPGALQDQASIEALVHAWLRNDWLRVIAATAGFLSTLRAISLPFPDAQVMTGPASLASKLAYAGCVLLLLAFVAYFVSELL
ncbi:DUF1772 domain-containing protein [Pseudoxanthomonas winnipegensis]|jgi:hypothetical protein|uniref:DUF1772 domain-containing protein n=1 Tax=Pseudoxanthomonas winnipegensis TaxID=2480810 RepID=A0ABY1WGC9_9GAMM|nr:DUF1772 domain-containing protein [Pseudoxanthomonas winnipegensis]TAA07959.1 DUF1772 domain-containing protein [Pseudoxanthomonas winnipegensis]TAA20951.1 DUF1772 domain-containing protein [Pseudoxanthomonas winnipegensis]TAH72420.1 DUF1772 domain-containing protein [Pseudoxanthomonas winnipegensis]